MNSQPINSNDLQAEIFLRNLQERDHAFRLQQRAALNSQQQQRRPVLYHGNPPNQMEIGSQEKLRPQKGNGANSHWELTMEIEEIKRKKNKDMEDIKLLKVELHKMETLYKKYKEISATTSSGQPPNLALPLAFFGDMDAAQWLSTEELLVETAKIKNLLQKEILQRKRIQESRRLEESTLSNIQPT